MKKRWVLKEQIDTESITDLAKALNIDDYLAKLLAQRGVDSFEKARSFFRPQLSMLHDPFLMKDMEK